MRFLSLFSGIEAASVAWLPLGWEAVAFAEIEQFPCAVLAHHYPNIPNLGDVTKIDWTAFNERFGTVDIVIGGSPCQSFSLAAGGGRLSLHGQSGLMFEYLRCIEAVLPRWILWENVPGVLSTSDNAFGQLLTYLQEIGDRDIAWTVLNARYFGVAQSRQRVFLVGHKGAEGFRSAAVLFDQASLQRVIKSPNQRRPHDTGAVAEEIRGRGFCIGGDNGHSTITTDVVPTLTARGGGACVSGTLTAHYAKGICIDDLKSRLVIWE